MCDYEKNVPAAIRRHFTAAYKGQYGWWFEFDGAVRFQDPQGGGQPFPAPTDPRLTSVGR